MFETTSAQEASFNKLLAAISSVPDEETVTCTMPVEEAVAEGERVLALIKQDDAKLRATGIEEKFLDTLADRVGAFVWGAATVQALTDSESSAAKEWTKRKPEGVKVRKLLLRDFAYAFRKHPGLMQSVQQIIDGKGNRDFLLDILACSKVGTMNIDLLKKINADLSLLSQAATLYTELSDIFARMTIDPDKHLKVQTIYNKAWTCPKEALDEIYDAGRYAFDESDPHHQLYYSDYYIRLGQSSAKAKSDAAEAKKAETAGELVSA
jgi:hypothetical protein